MMFLRTTALLLLALVADPGESVRLKRQVQGIQNKTRTDSQAFHMRNSTIQGDSAELGMYAGRVLGGRFRLESLIESETRPPLGQFFGMIGAALGGARPFGIGGGIEGGKVPREKPGQKFPSGTPFSKQTGLKHLGNGQFGDVWEAHDLQGRKRVAVKVFYRKLPRGGKEYLTWNTADQFNREEMRKNVQECKLIREIIDKGKGMYPVGASRICACSPDESYIEEGMKAGNRDNVMYSVWEMCGTSMTKLRESFAKVGAKERVESARHLTKQVIEAVYLLNMFKPELIHHDMKADNAVVLGSLAEGYKVKLIDFGCFVRASQGNKHSQSIGDPHYMPPEHSVTSRAFATPPSSFDMYGVGLIHMELLCPGLSQADWSPVARGQMGRLGQKPVVEMATIKAAIKRKCPEFSKWESFGGKDISDDFNLIENLIFPRPTARLMPRQALKHKAFRDLVDKVISLEFKKGDAVEYYSESRGVWMPCVIMNANAAQGTYDLGQAMGGGKVEQFKPGAPANRVRAQKPVGMVAYSIDESFQIPLVGMVYNVGDKVEYYASTLRRWVVCVISAVEVNEETVVGTYNLDTPDGTPFRPSVAPERVRDLAYPPGTKVIVQQAMAGYVRDYDYEHDFYTVKTTEMADGNNVVLSGLPRDLVELDPREH